MARSLARSVAACLLLFAPLLPAAETPAPAPAPATEPTALRALVIPARETVLASQMAGRMVEIFSGNGDRFKEGQVLVRFDCRVRQARLEKIRAQLQASEKTHQANLVRKKLSSIGDLEVALSEIQIQERQAEIKGAQAEVELCAIKAPYAGRVVRALARAHQSVKEGEPLLEILDDAQLEVQVFVPSSWIPRLGAGAPFSLLIDETGQAYPVKIAKVGAKVDPSSHTVEITAAFSGDHKDLLPGMSGLARFEAAHVP